MGFIYPWDQGSRSALALSRELGWKRIRHERSRFRPAAHKTVLNWGSTTMPDFAPCGVLNGPRAVERAVNKLLAFGDMEAYQVPIPWFCTDHVKANEWLYVNAPKSIVARTILNGTGGVGIVISNNPLELPIAPLYVEYVPKKEEYRVHIFNGQVIDVQQKVRRIGVPDEMVDWRIRNHSRGFVYARQGVEPPDAVLDGACRGIRALTLDFGAVDVVWNEKHQRAAVLEVNTAPGLEGQTVQNYAAALRKFVGKVA